MYMRTNDKLFFQTLNNKSPNCIPPPDIDLKDRHDLVGALESISEDKFAYKSTVPKRI